MPRRQQTGKAKARLKGSFEPVIRAQLDEAQVRYAYEPLKIPYVIPEETHFYFPDWVLLDNGIIIETKGWPFDAQDRRKILLVREQHPDLDLRLVFSNDRIKIYSGSKTTAGDWADQHGITHASKRIPPEWFLEKPNSSSLRALTKLHRKITPKASRSRKTRRSSS